MDREAGLAGRVLGRASLDRLSSCLGLGDDCDDAVEVQLCCCEVT